MTDIQDLRARMREERGRQPMAATGAGFKLPFGLLAGAAVILGFVVVMFTPKIYSVQRTAALPDFKEVRERTVSPEPVLVAAAAPAPVASAHYAGKSTDEIAKIADGVCAQRVALARSGPPTRTSAAEDKLSCFLSEAPARFCSGSQTRKATADIINYFKGIEYTNAALSVTQKVLAMPGPNRAPFKGDAHEEASRKATQAAALLTPDPRVVEAVEGLMRAGYLTKGHREDIGASVPRAYKERFALIAGNKAPCPETPWWVVWK
jgi:hypothetical protein